MPPLITFKGDVANRRAALLLLAMSLIDRRLDGMVEFLDGPCEVSPSGFLRWDQPVENRLFSALGHLPQAILQE